MLTSSELSFLRLLDRTKKLAREDLSANVWKVNAAITYLDNLFNKLQDEKGLHNADMLMQYGRELSQMKLLVEAENCKSSEDKLSQLNLIPRHFPAANVDIESHGFMSHQSKESASEVRLRTRAVYRADLRKQLLGEEKRRREEMSDDLIKHEEKQENFANELLSLTRSLKQNMTVAGNVLKDDNKRLSSMNAQVDANTAKLSVEGTRLAHHAYKCGFDCALVFVALFIFWSFICMVVMMKMFPKRVTS